jgi:hypothetical protein
LFDQICRQISREGGKGQDVVADVIEVGRGGRELGFQR